MILIRNTQRTISINKELISQQAQQILNILNYSDFDLGIWITNDKTIRFYNREYRHKDKATDILSFPYYPELQAGKQIKAKTQEEKNLGDLIISAPYVLNEAQKLGVSLEDRLKILLVHGVCHLLGYDHIEDADYRRMRAKEAYIIKKLQ
ncbi:MAG TPA: rRNA maturation RNase YbeY [Candidatus Babeliaceae bacterium]|nr:rRNA maturation RNase YbeY [Candidatus Babeliaceae bacterium]